MCGIAGFNWNDSNLIKKMNNSLKHRGPDGSGIYTDNLVSLGHRRLAIIDLTERGKQPMEYEHKGRKAVITYNGEVYNFLELREKLERKGYKFKSNTDTEVILASYLEWGFDCVKKFNGMWAFCIYDPQKKILFCSRDRMGQKPFYYYYDGERFIFASEIKGILNHEIERKLNRKALDLYLSLGFIPAPYSILEKIFKLERNQNLIFDLYSKKITKSYYWDLPKYKPEYNEKKIIREIKKLLENSVKLRKIADVEVGTFLSGGLDSSLITSILKIYKDKLHTFSIGFDDEKYDESKYAYFMSNYLNTIHHHYYFTKKDFEKLLNKLPIIYDEPFADMSAFPTIKVSELARKYVVVSLSGDGGDEIFGGYPLYKIAARIELLKHIPQVITKNLYNLFKILLNNQNVLKGLELVLINRQNFYSHIFSENRISSIWYTQNFRKVLNKNKNLVESSMKFDLLFNTVPDKFTVKIDRASMYYSLEVRFPYLDYRILEYSSKIPTEYKVDIIRTKKIMRKLMKDYVPSKIISRGKKGFTPPIKEWLLKEYSNIVESCFKNLKNKNLIFHKNLLKNKEITKIYRYLIFSLWLEKW